MPGQELIGSQYLSYMTILSFAESFRSKTKSPKADILERWNNRVVAQGLDKRGRAGAADYLARYGKGISAKKVVDLALMAEFVSAIEVAAGFWEQAFLLETGNSESYSSPKGVVSAPVSVPTSRKVEVAPLVGLPADFQVGRISTMQPTDASRPQSSYIVDPAYFGQPKRDGHKNVVFAVPTACAHQSRSTKAATSFSSVFDKAAKLAASELGAFVLEGEKTYLSVGGGEHRTASEAATENVNLGKGDAQVVVMYSAFQALFHNVSLFNASALDRIKVASDIVAAINHHLSESDKLLLIVEATPTAITTAEKAALVEDQKANGREGEVWTLINCTYTAGKDHKVASVRTKDIIEIDAVISAVNRSACQGRSIASFGVVDLDGKEIGSVGTGFDEKTALSLAAQHEANSGTVKITVRCQKFTVNGQMWHARMI